MTSMLWKHILSERLLDNTGPAKELNFVFDNCGGQNKNRMVLRFMVMLAKLNAALVVRAIFLIKGHTKNDCDRMFNLLKLDYRKLNIYTPQELYLCLNRHPSVTAIEMETDEDFLEFSALQDLLMIPAINGCKKHHIFTVTAARSNVLVMQAADGEDEVEMVVVLPNKQGDDIDWRQAMKTLEISTPPGLPDIKWLELYAKWGKFVPLDVKKTFKYYTEKPPKMLEAEIRANSKAAKSTRQNRSRTTAGARASTKKEAKKS